MTQLLMTVSTANYENTTSVLNGPRLSRDFKIGKGKLLMINLRLHLKKVKAVKFSTCRMDDIELQDFLRLRTHFDIL